MLGNYITDKSYYGGYDYTGGEQYCLDSSNELFCWGVLICVVLAILYLMKSIPILMGKSGYISHLDGRSFANEGIMSQNNHMKQSATQRVASGISY